jgi:hypothetical protein
MPRRNDPERIRHAKLTGAAMAVRDQMVLASPDAVAEQRAAIPDLWERLDRLAELLTEG